MDDKGKFRLEFTVTFLLQRIDHVRLIVLVNQMETTDYAEVAQSLLDAGVMWNEGRISPRLTYGMRLLGDVTSALPVGVSRLFMGLSHHHKRLIFMHWHISQTPPSKHYFKIQDGRPK